MQHNNPVPYVKLFHHGIEIKMPSRLVLTEKSKALLKKAEEGQGFIYYVRLITDKKDTGEIVLLAANNPEKQTALPLPQHQISPHQDLLDDDKEITHLFSKLSSTLEKLYEEDEKLSQQIQSAEKNSVVLETLSQQQKTLKTKIQENAIKRDAIEEKHFAIQRRLRTLSSRKMTALAEIKVNIPKDRNGIDYAPDEYATTTREKTHPTGGSGNGDLHANGARVLKLGNDQPILAGGFWITWLGNNPGEKLGFTDFRTRSTTNMRIIKFNPIHRFIFNMRADGGNKVGHTQVYLREIPYVYLQPILNVFLEASKEIYLEYAAKNNITTTNIENDLVNDVKKSFLFTHVNVLFKYKYLKFVKTNHWQDWGYATLSKINFETLFIHKTDNDFTVFWREDNEIISRKVNEKNIQEDLEYYFHSRSRTQDIINIIVSTYQCTPSRSALPAPTRWHLQMERNWQLNTDQIERIKTAIEDRNRPIDKIEIDSLLKGYFNKDFVENRQLLKDLFKYIHTDNPFLVLTKHINHLLDDYFKALLKNPVSEEMKNIVNTLLNHFPEERWLLRFFNRAKYDIAKHLLEFYIQKIAIEEISWAFESLIAEKKYDLIKLSLKIKPDLYKTVYDLLSKSWNIALFQTFFCPDNPLLTDETLTTNRTMMRQQICDALNHLKEQYITRKTFVVFLQAYKNLPQKTFPQQLFQPRKNLNKNAAIDKLLLLLTNNKPVQMPPVELDTLINANGSQHSLLKKIIYFFYCIPELKGFRKAVDHNYINRHGEFHANKTLHPHRIIHFDQQSFHFSNTYTYDRSMKLK